MTDVLLFHHVQGLTSGMRALAAELAGNEHTVTTPDLYDGRTFASVEDGFAHLQGLDGEVLRRRVDELVAALPGPVVYAGVSWGVAHAQRLAQTRPGALGALLLEACFPLGADGFGPWPPGLPVQVHGMEQDVFFGLEGDLEAARELVATVGDDHAEVVVHPGDRHLFVDSSLPSYDAAATGVVVARARELLARV